MHLFMHFTIKWFLCQFVNSYKNLQFWRKSINWKCQDVRNQLGLTRVTVVVEVLYSLRPPQTLQITKFLKMSQLLHIYTKVSVKHGPGSVWERTLFVQSYCVVITFTIGTLCQNYLYSMTEPSTKIFISGSCRTVARQHSWLCVRKQGIIHREKKRMNQIRV